MAFSKHDRVVLEHRNLRYEYYWDESKMQPRDSIRRGRPEMRRLVDYLAGHEKELTWSSSLLTVFVAGYFSSSKCFLATDISDIGRATDHVHSLHSRHHRRRSTHEDLDVMIRGWEVFLDLLLCDEADTALPLRRRVVEDVEHFKAVLVLLRELVELRAEKDVLDVHIGVDERELRTVEWVLERRSDDLEHGRYARPACDHADLARQRGMVFELALRSFDADFISDLEKREVPRDVALLVCLP